MNEILTLMWSTVTGIFVISLITVLLIDRSERKRGRK